MDETENDPTIDQPLDTWLANFDPRMRQEIGLARDYVKRFNHGTPGHLSYQVIDRLASVLEAYRRQGYTLP